MKKGLIAENVETEYFHSQIYVWLQWIDPVWSKAFVFAEVRDPITIRDLLVTFESPVVTSNPLSTATAGHASGVPRRSYK